MGNCCKKKKASESLISEEDVEKALDINESNPLGIKLN